MTAAKERVVLPNLNGLRFFAALSVIIYHTFAVYNIRAINGHYGVVLFFTLSGFLITYLLLTELDATSTINIGKFYVRRILRIWPLYFLIVFLAGIMISKYDAANLGRYYSNLPYYLFFVPNLLFAIGKGSLYADILWSVGSEEQFYLLWPFLLLLVPRAYLAYALVVIIAFFTVMPHLLDYANSHYYAGSKESITIISNMIQRMCFNAMSTGAFCALLYKTKSGLITKLFNPVVQILGFAALLICWVGRIEFRFFNDELYSFFFVIIILNLALNSETLISLNNRLLEYLGKISYGLYVYHLIVIELVVHYFIPEGLGVLSKSFLLFFYSLSGTILISAISYEFFEKPFLRIKETSFTIIRSGDKT